MTWNPQDHYGITELRLPASSIWLPDIVLTNRWAFEVPPHLKKIGGHQSFLWGHWYPCFGPLVTSALGFKARVPCVLCHCVQWIIQIHLSIWERESKFYAFLALGTEVAKVMFSEASVSHSVHMGWVPTPPPTWHLPHTVSKRAVRILLESFLVTFISTRNKFKEDITQFYNL